LQILLEVKVKAANDSLQRTPDLLPVLKDAGVVDSGGQGWTFMIEGMLRLTRGEELQLEPVIVSPGERPGWQEALEPEDEEGYGYDVQFLMRGQGMNVDEVRKAISEIGWSTLVVGDDKLIKVHVHVHDPGLPISYAIKQGAALDDLVVENMQLQYQSYVAERANREDRHDTTNRVEGIAVVTVAAGEGLKTLFTHDLGAAYVIAGGQTMNPSTEDFVKAIKTLENTEIILLPNNPNVLLAAQQASTLVENKSVRVVTSRTIPQGIAAMLEYANERDSLDLLSLTEGMNNALKGIVTCEITTATRDANVDGLTVREGQYIGLIDDKLSVAGESIEVVAVNLLRKAGADERELITLYYGEGVSQEETQTLVDTLTDHFPEQEFQIVNGGQPLYPYIISVE
jgi:hypothetical protein